MLPVVTGVDLFIVGISPLLCHLGLPPISDVIAVISWEVLIEQIIPKLSADLLHSSAIMCKGYLYGYPKG